MRTHLLAPAPAVALVLALLTSACAGTSQADAPADTGSATGTTPSATPSWPSPTAAKHDVLAVGFGPHRVSIGAGSVWVASMTGAVHRLDDRRVRLLAEVGSGLVQVAVTAGRVFVGDNKGSRVLVYDERSGARAGVLRAPGPVRSVVEALGAVWVTAGDSVVRYDPRTLRQLSAVAVGGEAAQLAQSGATMVATNRTIAQVSSLDRTGKLVGTATIEAPAIGVTVTPEQIWVLHANEPSLTVMSRERFAPIDVIELPGVAFGAATVGDEVWVTLFDNGTVARLGASGELRGQLTVGRQPLGIVADDDWVWVANQGESSVWRLPADLADGGS